MTINKLGPDLREEVAREELLKREFITQDIVASEGFLFARIIVFSLQMSTTAAYNSRGPHRPPPPPPRQKSSEHRPLPQPSDMQSSTTGPAPSQPPPPIYQQQQNGAVTSSNNAPRFPTNSGTQGKEEVIMMKYMTVDRNYETLKSVARKGKSTVRA